MSEFTGTRCDGCGTLTDVSPENVSVEGWEEDDRGGHTCPDCQKTAVELEDSMASNEDVSIFSETLMAVADTVLDSPEILKMKKERLEAYQKIKKDTTRAIRKEMQAVGMTQSDINKAIEDLERDLDEEYNRKFNFKLEA